MAEPLDLIPIKERVSKATKGPWRSVVVVNVEEGTECAEVLWDDSEESEEPEGPTIFTTEDYETADLHRPGVTTSPRADAAFVASSRQDVPALLQEVERLREENERHKTALAAALTSLDIVCDHETASYRAAQIRAALASGAAPPKRSCADHDDCDAASAEEFSRGGNYLMHPSKECPHGPLGEHTGDDHK